MKAVARGGELTLQSVFFIVVLSDVFSGKSTTLPTQHQMTDKVSDKLLSTVSN